MRCEVLKRFKHQGEIQLPGSIIEVPESMYSRMDGYVQTVIVTENNSCETGIVQGFCNYRGICSVSVDKCIGSFPDTCHQMECEHLSQIRTCRCCNGTDFWESAVQDGHSVCRRCHPPMEGAEKIS